VDDYTATSGTSVVLGTGATADDVVEIIVYDVFSVGNFYNRTDSDSRYLNVAGDTMTGSLDLNGTELVLDVDGDTSITSDTDDQIDIKIAGADDFSFKANTFEVQTGSNIDMNGTELILDADGDSSITADTDDQVDIKLGGNDQVVVATGNTTFKAPDGGSRYLLGGTGNSDSAELSLYDSSDAQKVRIGAGADTFFNGGNVGIGTTSPYAILQTTQDTTNAIGLAIANSSDDGSADSVGISFGLARSGGLLFGIEGIRMQKEQSFTGTASTIDSSLIFQTIKDENTAEKMRIDSSGNILLGTSDSADTSGVGCKFRNTGAMTGTFNTSAAGTSGFHYYNTNGTYNGYRFYVRADGGVYNYSSANYNLSDEREKKNIADMGSHYEDFKKFKFRDFNYNTEEDSQPKKHGVIAQEVELVNSNLVGEDFRVKVDEDGKDVLRKGLKEEQFVMIGLKTLQETIVKLEGALARIETLEARIKKLEDG
jgi:hypothetical protein